MHAQPKFELGARGIVFLSDNPRLYTPVVAMQQGFLEFAEDGPDKRTVKDGFGRTIETISGANSFVVGDGEGMSDTTLIAAIRNLVG